MSGYIKDFDKEEFEGADRTHDLDNDEFIKYLKKVIKDSKIRVNEYIIKDLKNDNENILKIQLEKFNKGKSEGTRWIKGYLSDEKLNELVKLLDAIPKKIYQDARDNIDKERPKKKIISDKITAKDLDFSDMWNN